MSDIPSVALEDFWTPWELFGSHYAAQWIDHYLAVQYGPALAS